MGSHDGSPGRWSAKMGETSYERRRDRGMQSIGSHVRGESRYKQIREQKVREDKIESECA